MNDKLKQLAFELHTELKSIENQLDSVHVPYAVGLTDEMIDELLSDTELKFHPINNLRLSNDEILRLLSDANKKNGV